MPVWKRPGAACPIIDSTVPVNLINLWIVIPPVRRESVGHPWVRSDRLQVQHCRLPAPGIIPVTIIEGVNKKGVK